MSDAISEGYRAAREEKERAGRREAYLVAALVHLLGLSDWSLAAVIETYGAIQAARRYDESGSRYRYDPEAVAACTREKFEALARADLAEWVNFLLKDIGIDDADMRQKFLEVSPFKGCLVILSRFDPQDGYDMVGDTSRLMSEIAKNGSAKVEAVYEATVHLPSRFTPRDTRVHIYRVTPKK